MCSYIAGMCKSIFLIGSPGKMNLEVMFELKLHTFGRFPQQQMWSNLYSINQKWAPFHSDWIGNVYLHRNLAERYMFLAFLFFPIYFLDNICRMSNRIEYMNQLFSNRFISINWNGWIYYKHRNHSCRSIFLFPPPLCWFSSNAHWTMA